MGAERADRRPGPTVVSDITGTVERRDARDPALRLAGRQAGWLLVLCGGLGDCIAGWLALSHGPGWSLLIHVPAMMTWGAGLCVTSPAGKPGDASDAVPRWPVLLTLLGLVVFPGFVPFACTVALGLTRIMPAVGTRPPTDSLFDGPASDEDEPEPVTPSIVMRATEGSPRADVEPLTDLMRDGNSELRRAAIATAAKHGTPTAWRLIRGMLKDPDPDVRTDASVILASHETALHDAITDAELRSRTDASAAQHFAALCYTYAISDLADETTRKRYLVKAKSTVGDWLRRQPDNVKPWLLLAQIHMSMGEMTAAMDAVQHARALDGEAGPARLMAAEIAFRQRDWPALQALALETSCAERRQDARFAILDWWAETRTGQDGESSDDDV